MAVVLLIGCAAPQTPEDRMRERARALISEDEARRGNVWIACEPGDAEVSIDGLAQGTCAQLGALDRGLGVAPDRMHRLEVKKRGYLPYVTYIAPGGARAALRVRLSPTERPLEESP